MKSKLTVERDQRTLAILREVKSSLVSATSACRLDMHEPDEQGVRAMVIGDHLDNAMGNAITVENGYQEYLVILSGRGLSKPTIINLADLIALARLANLEETQ